MAIGNNVGNAFNHMRQNCMKMFFLAVAATILSGCASPSPNVDIKSYSTEAEYNIYEAVLRWRLEQKPLGASDRCYVYIDNGHIFGLPARLKEYRLVIRAGAPDSKRPRDRWYWLRLGQVRRDRAFIMVRDAQRGLRALELVREGNRWRVVSDERFIVT